MSVDDSFEDRLRRLADHRPTPSEQAQLDLVEGHVRSRKYADLPRRRRNLVPAMVAALVVVVAGGTLAVELGRNHPAATARAGKPSPAAITPSPAVTGPPVSGALVAGQALSIDDIKMTSANTGWSLYGIGQQVQNRYVLRTTDAARTWHDVTPRQLASSTGIADGFFLDNLRGWIAVDQPPIEGSTGTRSIYRTADGGVSWTARGSIPASDRPGRALHFLDALHGWADGVGQPASQNSFQSFDLATTSDGGITWTSRSPGPFDANQSPTRPGLVPFACGKAGAGFRDITNGWISGGCLGGITFYRTQDGGATWQKQALAAPGGGPIGPAICSGGPCSLSPPVFTSHLDGWMVLALDTHRDALYTTHDGGSTWAPHLFPATGYGGVPVFINSTTGWLGLAHVGASQNPTDTYAAIWNTTDDGQTWHELHRGALVGLVDLGFIDVHNGFGIFHSYQSSVIHPLEVTTDGGRTWTELHPVFAG